MSYLIISSYDHTYYVFLSIIFYEAKTRIKIVIYINKEYDKDFVHYKNNYPNVSILSVRHF